MVKKKASGKKKETTGRYKGARLTEARRVAREAARTSPVGVLSLPGVGFRTEPKDPSADLWVQNARAVFVVRGLSRKGKKWIEERAEGYEGDALFGPGAYTIDPEAMAPLIVGFKAASLTVTP